MELEDIRNANNEDLIKGVFDHYGTRISNAIQAELTKRQIAAINDLSNAIEKLDKTTTKYSCWLVTLTVVIAVLTLVMVIKMFIR